ncbi:LIC_10190 family membrane protein [Candidatus Pelagibacter communis]|uniref:LIC_10190 family membrane protein n=1 Tax=Pelagibacter ubique TaxID=198252 RepID=UPI00094CB2F4
MVINYLIFILFYFLIVFSVLGHGLLTSKLVKLDTSPNEIGFIGLTGIFSLITYSYITHFFFQHNYLHNSIFLIIGIISFFIYGIKVFQKRNLKILIAVFAILFVAFLIYKTHDDFGYYHFPYTYYLNKFSMIVGIGPLNHGFRTPSSIFYLNSLFYLPYVEYYLFHMGAVLILGFSNIILITNIERNLEKKNNNYFFFLNLLAFVFINIFFYRLAEHGTDRSAQILVLLFFIYILSLRENYEKYDKILPKLIVLLCIIISLKSFYILYFIFIVPFIYYTIKDDKAYLLNKIFKHPIFYFSILMGICVILVYFFNTGCLLYPVQQTCISGVEWAIPKSEVSAMNTHYQWWSKAGGGPGYSHEIEKDLYVQNFNWLSNWVDRYFFNKMSDFLLGITSILVIFLIVFKSKKKNLDYKRFKNNFLYYFLILLLFTEWFLNHPSLRYGGYIIFSLILFVPLSYFLSSYQISKNFKLKIFILFFLVVSIFIARNINRIIYEVDFYQANFKQNMFYFIDNKHLRIDTQLMDLAKTYQNCNQNIEKCINNGEFIIKKSYGKLVLIKIRNK